MSIEAFQIASAFLAGTTIGFAHLSYGLHRKLKEAHQHVPGLQKYVADQCEREGALIRKADELVARVNELEAFETRVKNQRTNALRVAAEKRAANAAQAAEVEAAARDKTLNALKVTPLRTRAEVVADVKREARQVSSAG